MMRAYLVAAAAILVSMVCMAGAAEPQRLEYNHPGLAVDLGVGLWAWPMPMDYDRDGDLDLIVSCADKPYNGLYFFENPGTGTFPVFKPAVRIDSGMTNVQVSYVDGQPRVLRPGTEFVDFRRNRFGKAVKLPVDPKIRSGKLRANQWKYCDYDGDGRLDLIVGIGDWTEYGWDNAFNAEGQWTRGPLHGYVYWLRNTGSNDEPQYDEPAQVTADGKPVDVYGMPSPNFADFDSDGDLDLLCGEFVDRFTYFQNVGTRTAPKYARGRFMGRDDGTLLKMDLCMFVPVAIDWDTDGDIDLVVGEEDGRVALVENTGRVVDGLPQFLSQRQFQQEARYVKFGALVTPVSCDWDDDGDEDLICGNTAGYVGFIENLDGGSPPRWAPPAYLKADGQVIRIQAGYNGSIQGPCEAKWGYTTLSVADWDDDGLKDLVVNSIWGKVIWYRNVGTAKQPRLEAARPVEVQWEGRAPKPAWNWWRPASNELVTQWRTTPLATDLNGDGLTDLVSLDHEGYLAFFERVKKGGETVLLPPERIFQERNGGPLRLNPKSAGGSGRRKLCLTDWDGDGRLDLMANSINVDFFHNVSEKEGRFVFAKQSKVASRRLAGHTTSPTMVDWDGDGIRDLLIGAEDGFLYYLENPRSSGGSVLPEPVTFESGPAVTVEGHSFSIGTFEPDARAYNNRSYVWKDVPAQLDGWMFTRTSGGRRARITVTPTEDGPVYVATCLGQSGIDTTRWTEMPLSFYYTDGGKSVMTVLRKDVKKGQTVEVPQGNWSGGIVLAPKIEMHLTEPPGAIIDRSDDPGRVYIGSPSLAVLPNGTYVASHDLFGPGTSKDVTVVLVSDDRGRTWAKRATVKGQWWSTLFVHRGALYLIGTSKSNGDTVIRRSLDGGRTWTEPKDGDSGLLLDDGGYHCAPVPVVIHAGRIWRAMEDTHAGNGWPRQFRAFVISAPVDADLLDASNWTFTNRLHFDPQWLPATVKASRPGWLEGNVVIAPDGEVLNILRFNDDRGDRACIAHVSADGTKLTYDPERDMIDFPGGRNKFTIRFDPETERYWSLVNKETHPRAYRNILALTSSADLRHWTVESIVLRHPDSTNHAWQYIDWLFEGDDIIFASRTAWDGSHKAHDANYFTFHRLEDFRRRTMDDPPLNEAK